MAEKDAKYYHQRAAEARANGNDRLAQIMENYATNLDAGIYNEGSTWSPQRNPNAPTRGDLQSLYNQKMAVDQGGRPNNSNNNRGNYKPPGAPSDGNRPNDGDKPNDGGAPNAGRANDLEAQANLEPGVDFSGAGYIEPYQAEGGNGGGSGAVTALGVGGMGLATGNALYNGYKQLPQYTPAGGAPNAGGWQSQWLSTAYADPNAAKPYGAPQGPVRPMNVPSQPYGVSHGGGIPSAGASSFRAMTGPSGVPYGVNPVGVERGVMQLPLKAAPVAEATGAGMGGAAGMGAVVATPIVIGGANAYNNYANGDYDALMRQAGAGEGELMYDENGNTIY